jgi:hypothetical protein
MMIPGTRRTVYLVYPDATEWVVRRGDADHGTCVRWSTREAALLGARELADACRPSRIEVSTARGIIALDYDA